MSEQSNEQQPTEQDFYTRLAEAMVPKVAEAIDYDKLAEALLPKLAPAATVTPVAGVTSTIPTPPAAG